MKELKKFILGVIDQVFRLLSYIIPKQKGLLVFQQWHNKDQFSGNVKNLILYAKDNWGQDVLYVGNKRICDEAGKEGVISIYGLLRTYWVKIRAEYLIVDASIPKYYNWNIKIVQLWHGTGFKNIALLNGNNIKRERLYKKLKKHYQKYHLIVATSEADKKRKEDSFASQRVIVTGSPRNDLFFETLEYKNGLKNKFRIEKYDRIIIYTPTYRDSKTQSPFSDTFWERLNQYLASSNTLFIVKKHPWDTYLEVPSHLGYIKDMTKEISDVQELLIISDLIISDYSGIITDFAITNRPILLYMYDFQEYLQTNRSFYYDLEKILPKPFVYDENDLLNKIMDLSWMEDATYKKSYEMFRNEFHQYLDGNSSARVLDAIRKISQLS